MVSCAVDLVHNLQVLQTGFLFDSLTGFTPFAFILILSGGKICILKTNLFKEECLFCRCWFCGYSRYLLLRKISPQIYKQYMCYLSCSVNQEFGYGLAELSSSRSCKGAFKMSARDTVSSEAWLGRDLLLSSHGVGSTYLPMDCQMEDLSFLPGFWLEAVLMSLPCVPCVTACSSKPAREFPKKWVP